MAQIFDRFVIGFVWQADDRIGRRWSAEAITRDEKARDRAADQAGDDQPERRGRDADFKRIGDAEALGDDRRPRDRGAVSADKRGGANERNDPLRQAERGYTA